MPLPAIRSRLHDYRDEHIMNVVSPKPVRSAVSLRAGGAERSTPIWSRSDAPTEPGRYCVVRALEAARVLENPDSSEEEQQVAREALRETLRRMLCSR